MSLQQVVSDPAADSHQPDAALDALTGAVWETSTPSSENGPGHTPSGGRRRHRRTLLARQHEHVTAEPVHQRRVLTDRLERVDGLARRLALGVEPRRQLRLRRRELEGREVERVEAGGGEHLAGLAVDVVRVRQPHVGRVRRQDRAVHLARATPTAAARSASGGTRRTPSRARRTCASAASAAAPPTRCSSSSRTRRRA